MQGVHGRTTGTRVRTAFFPVHESLGCVVYVHRGLPVLAVRPSVCTRDIVISLLL